MPTDPCLYLACELCYNPDIDGSLHLSRATAAWDHQDAQFQRAFQVLNQAIAQRAFPAASIAVVDRGRVAALRAFGRFTYPSDSPEVTTQSIFDLASLTKVVATTSMAMILYERGLLDLDAPVVAIVPEFTRGDARRKAVTVRMLLTHSSGLPAYEKLFLRAKTREELLGAAYATGLTADPGSRTEYSDIGFIVLGVLLERVADEGMDGFCQREVFGRMGMAQTTFRPPPSWRASIPPTADDRVFRQRVVQGEVQDENASVMGGVAGHAGLFAPAADLGKFALAMLGEQPALVAPQTLEVFTRRESFPPGSSRALGWDTPSPPSQSGKYFSARSFGHLGYTGTSLWIDRERQLSVTLLTNRTWPDSSNQAIREVRPAFHDAIVEALENP
jgi:serine-type D-Ala-D-Ala carboxypeptidase